MFIINNDVIERLNIILALLFFPWKLDELWKCWWKRQIKKAKDAFKIIMNGWRHKKSMIKLWLISKYQQLQSNECGTGWESAWSWKMQYDNLLEKPKNICFMKKYESYSSIKCFVILDLWVLPTKETFKPLWCSWPSSYPSLVNQSERICVLTK